MNKIEIQYEGRNYTITVDFDENMETEYNLYNGSGKHMVCKSTLKEIQEQFFPNKKDW